VHWITRPQRHSPPAGLLPFGLRPHSSKPAAVTPILSLRLVLKTGEGQNTLNIEYVLGFNEPERPDQANMSVAQAIDVWDIMDDQLSGAGLKLVSPGVSDNLAGREWLADFMSQAAANNLIVDEIAFHWYGGVNPNNPVGSANGFLSRVDSYYNTYGLPIWITEFAGLDFGNTVGSPELIAANAAFLEVAIPGLESRPYVNRYSWWQYGQSDNGEQDDSRLIEQINGVWTPTVIGDPYLPTYGTGETFDIDGTDYSKDTIYLKGGTVTNTGAPITPAVDSVYALENTNVMGGTSDWAMGEEGTVEINSGATLQKQDTNTIRLLGTQVNNRGTFHLSQGTVSLEDGVQVSGTGSVQLDPGATMSLGSAPDRAGVGISQPLELHGGTVVSNPIADGTHIISGTNTTHGTTTFEGSGLLVVTGPIVAPSGGGGGGITKAGSGTLYLANNNTYEVDTTVEEGTLRLASGGTLSGSQNIAARPSGTLNVTEKPSGYILSNQNLALEGKVVGSIQATGGSTITPLGSSNLIEGNLTVSNSMVSVGGDGFNEMQPVPTIVSTGLQLNFDAALDTAGDSTWTNAASPGSDVAFAGGSSPAAISAPSHPGVTAAYHIPTVGGAEGLNQYFEGQSPQRSQRDASFEVVFHVSDTSAGGDQVLAKVGGTGRGVSFLLNDGSLSFNVNGDDTATSTLSTSLSPGWHHAVGVIDLSGQGDDLANDSMSLYVNNVLIGTLENLLIDDWAGGNLSGIGDTASVLGAGGTPIPYHDSIAIVRYYNDIAFGSTEVGINHNNLVGSGVALPTQMNIDGDYLQQIDGTLQMDLFSPSSHDALDVTGTATLDGLLDINEVDGLAPSVGDTFTILSADGGVQGEFDSVELPILSGLQWFLDYSANDVSLSVIYGADFDGSGTVDGADLMILQRGMGLTGQLDNSNGDADGNGVIDSNDLAIWKAQYGTSPGLLTSSLKAVPEPSSAFLLTVVVLGLVFQRRGNQ
ncbi:MAG: glycosyl hydrolase, partial [Lacipirellulaceae bacterium]